ncbi:hypothetical protein OPT61_g2657 [Boeremia exigua]|uniref:Uncharacterized protein n=1 Tax=Boeremia exigua TaxID=749465 RepID=A0ACC2IKP5_9PLEO|nr:hypothetical protein OPT61_g2657 [Boeremia exigua]
MIVSQLKVAPLRSSAYGRKSLTYAMVAVQLMAMLIGSHRVANIVQHLRIEAYLQIHIELRFIPVPSTGEDITTVSTGCRSSFRYTMTLRCISPSLLTPSQSTQIGAAEPEATSAASVQHKTADERLRHND